MISLILVVVAVATLIAGFIFSNRGINKVAENVCFGVFGVFLIGALCTLLFQTLHTYEMKPTGKFEIHAVYYTDDKLYGVYEYYQDDNITFFDVIQNSEWRFVRLIDAKEMIENQQ